ncbi:GIY-YIG nuclease family protein [Selenomonas sp. AE3005]|uniref:GIY-YIG nuclease family protein n=1 Tax=Selenomonas sp. AE3005 TaxID=1485543 RepID=UPI0025D70FB4|nr:GIY-YIG nuclease family protein [Selenomonas sp. AE3005]
MPSNEENYTYILECSDGSFYTGWTNDLVKRVRTHNAGRGGKYTRSRLPVRLVYFETFADKREAQSREWHIKRLTHEQKQALIAGNGGLESSGFKHS